MDGRQSDACASILVLPVQALERPEQPPHIGHVESHPVIAHEKDGFAVAPGLTKLYAGRSAPPGVLPGVIKQVAEHRPEQSGVRFDDDARADHEVDLPVGLRVSQFGRDRGCQRAQVNPLRTEFNPADPAEREERIDEVAHRGGRLADTVERILPVVAQLAGTVLQKDLAESVDAPERCPEIMGDRVAEGLQLPIGVRQFGGLALQVRVQLGDPFLGLLSVCDITRGCIQHACVFIRQRLPGQPSIRTVLTSVPILESDGRHALLQPGHFCQGGRPILRVDKIKKRLPHQFLRRMAERLGEGRTDPREVALGVGDAQHVEGQREELIELRPGPPLQGVLAYDERECGNQKEQGEAEGER
jgi:hypothetical protein